MTNVSDKPTDVHDFVRWQKSTKDARLSEEMLSAKAAKKKGKVRRSRGWEVGVVVCVARGVIVNHCSSGFQPAFRLSVFIMRRVWFLRSRGNFHDDREAFVSF